MKRLRGLLLLGLLLAAGAARADAGGGDWRLPNLGWTSTRAQPGSAITPATVSRLHVLWRFRIPRSSVVSDDPNDTRAVVATPIVAGSSVYIQDSKSNVYALDRETGRVRWAHRFNASATGRNGLAYSSGSVYGATDTTVFSLSAATGRMLWERRLLTPVEQWVDIAPTIAHNIVYTSTVGYPPGGRGAIYALDAHTGKVLWKFDTIRDPWKYPNEAGGGGAWHTASIDEAGNLYSGVANPGPWGGTRTRPNGGAFPGPALYTDSLVVLDGKTGRLKWYDQVTPHDVRDHDFQLPPILAELAVGGAQRQVVFGGGKAGIVIAWDRATRKRLWQTVVGVHRNDSGPLPPKRVTVCPGLLGGVETPMAYDGSRVFVPVVDLCAWGSATGYQAYTSVDPSKGRGEFLALDAASGRVLWRRALDQPDLGCATVASGVVFTSTFDGRIYGLDPATGATLWQARARAGINSCPSLSRDLLLVAAGSASPGLQHPVFEVVAYAAR